MIEEKKAEIEEVSIKLKEDVIKEIDEAKRRELVEKATRKIAELKEEIKEISAKRRDEFLFYMRKMNATKIANAAHDMGINVKKAVTEKFTSKGKPVTDMDFEYDAALDIELEEE
jgi:ribosomal protein L11